MSSSVDLAWDAAGGPRARGVVLIHSLGTDRSIWDTLSDSLRGSYRVIRLDLRGHGASPAPAPPYSLAALSLDVLRVADAAGLHNFHCCGISLGGLIALHLAIRHPERVRSLIAANTAAKIGTRADWDERCSTVRASGLPALADGVLSRWFSPGFRQREPERHAHAARLFQSTNPAGYIGCCEALADADLTPELARVSAPALIVAGDLDVSTPAADARVLHGAIAGSRLVVLPGAAHLANLDSSDRFDAAVSSFLREVDARATG